MKKKILLLISLMFIIPGVVKANERVEVKFKSCIDGDTANFVLNKKVIKVRFLAVNAPEIKHGDKKGEFYGVESADYTCNKLKKAKTIELEFDDGSEKEDKYGRYLAWIIVDNKNLQKDLVKKGYAEVKYLYGDYAYTKELKKLESKAKNEKLGMWKDKFDITFFFMNLKIQYKILITIAVIIIIMIYLHYDKKARRKALRKGKKEVKKFIEDVVEK